MASHLAGYADLLDVREVFDVQVHTTADPAVVVVEFAVDGAVVATGTPYRTQYIAVLAVRDGRVHHYRDYWDPTVFVDVPIGRAVDEVTW